VTRGTLVVFAKQPLEGAVKTRMTPPLTALEAAELYARMLADVLETSAAAAVDLGLEAVLAVHPPAAAPELVRETPPPFRLVAQRGLDLAERMSWAVGEAAAADAWPVLLRGSDSPALAVETIAEAASALEREDLVLVPDRDGGYGLVGLRCPAPGLFSHAMSTPHVARDTLRGAERLGLRARVLASCFDLDTVEDLRWLAEARAGCARTCRRTLEYLDAEDLWRHLGPGGRHALLHRGGGE